MVTMRKQLKQLLVGIDKEGCPAHLTPKPIGESHKPDAKSERNIIRLEGY